MSLLGNADGASTVGALGALCTIGLGGEAGGSPFDDGAADLLAAALVVPVERPLARKAASLSWIETGAGSGSVLAAAWDGTG